MLYFNIVNLKKIIYIIVRRFFMNSIMPVAQPISTPLQSEPISLISNSSIWETASSTAFWAFERTFTSFVDTAKGAAIYSVFVGAITKGESCKFFYNLIFNRKAFQHLPRTDASKS